MLGGIGRFCVLAMAAAAFCLTGCSSYKGDFVSKSEAELEQMEKNNDHAHQAFLSQNYDQAENILNELLKERTVSSPLYRMELISLRLMQNRNDEAHQLMEQQHNDIETLFDDKLAEKAVSVWHGEVNKVFKGDSYERATFYGLMALSFIRQKNYQDALRCVKNGILADADSNKTEALGDFPMLYYLGYLCCKKMNDPGEAAEYWRFLCEALAKRGINLYGKNGEPLMAGNCFEQLQKRDPNVLLVVWSGLPPTVMCLGEYKEKRTIIRGANPFHAVSVNINDSVLGFLPNNLGDVDYQATTRGGRLMDNVLNDKATAKKVMEVSRNIFFIVGSGLIIAGAESLSSLPVGLSLMGAGAGCYLLGGTAWIIGSMMNPAADGRYWRNLPGQFYMIPLELPEGSHTVKLSGYYHSDRVFDADISIDVKNQHDMTVIHTPMMFNGGIFAAALQNKNNEECSLIIEKAADQRMNKELK